MTALLWACGIVGGAALVCIGICFGIDKAQRGLKTGALIRREDHDNTIRILERNRETEERLWLVN